MEVRDLEAELTFGEGLAVRVKDVVRGISGRSVSMGAVEVAREELESSLEVEVAVAGEEEGEGTGSGRAV